MSFEKGIKKGNAWDDANKLHDVIIKHNFNISAKDEKMFEHRLSSALEDKKFYHPFISQTNNETNVQSVHCFGKKHRPDMTFGKNAIAIELKLVTYEGLKQAIGQGYIYRLGYKFVSLVLVITKDKKGFYEDLCQGKEKDLQDTLHLLAKEMRIFTYIVPAFDIGSGPGMKKCHAFFTPTDA